MATTNHLTTRLEVFIDQDPSTNHYEYRVALDRQTQSCGHMESRSIAEGYAHSVLARLRREHPALASTTPIWTYREQSGTTFRKGHIAIAITEDDQLHLSLHDSPNYLCLAELADLLEQHPLLRQLSGRAPLVATPRANDGVADLESPLARCATTQLSHTLARCGLNPQQQAEVLADVAEVAAEVRRQTLADNPPPTRKRAAKSEQPV